MRMYRGIAVVVGLGLCLTAGGEPPKAPKLPAKAVAAKADYAKVQEKAWDAYVEACKLAAEEYKKQLTAIQEEETKASNLDAAVAVRDEAKTVGPATAVPGAKVPATADLKRFLTNTQWAWGDYTLTFQANGKVKHAEWDGSKLVTRWEAIDRRTVVLVIESGRNVSRIAVLEFSEALGEFKGYDYGGEPFDVKKRITASPK